MPNKNEICPDGQDPIKAWQDRAYYHAICADPVAWEQYWGGIVKKFLAGEIEPDAFMKLVTQGLCTSDPDNTAAVNEYLQQHPPSKKMGEKELEKLASAIMGELEKINPVVAAIGRTTMEDTGPDTTGEQKIVDKPDRLQQYLDRMRDQF